MWRGTAFWGSGSSFRMARFMWSVVCLLLAAATWGDTTGRAHLRGSTGEIGGNPLSVNDPSSSPTAVIAAARSSRCCLEEPGSASASVLSGGFVPNELGKVMIVMYHDIQSEEREWVRSRDNFRNDLQRFYEEGFVLVTLSSYLAGEMDVPAGKTPLVLTFDDATPGQFRFIEQDGELVPDPGCAVGILLNFCEQHPEFGCAATFFVDFPAPFGVASQVEAKFRFLLEHGMEIGNHTYNHRNLRNSPPEQIAEELGRLAKTVRDICGYEVCSLALPYGGYPLSADALASGSWEETEYRNLGVLLVGAEPTPSPFSRDFRPLAIPRIRGSEDELSKWLSYFRRNPSARFVSDGDPRTVSVLRGQEDILASERLTDKTVVVRGARNVLSSGVRPPS